VGSFIDDNFARGSQVVAEATNPLFQGISDPVHTETGTLVHKHCGRRARILETETDSVGEEDAYEYDHDQHYGVTIGHILQNDTEEAVLVSDNSRQTTTLTKWAANYVGLDAC